MKINEAPFGVLLVLREKMGEEVRNTVYERRVGDALGKFVPAFGIRTTQGYLWRTA